MSEKCETLDLIKSRRSIRKFKSDPVPDELLDKIVEAGLFAASGMNTQTPIIIKMTDPAMIKKLSKLNADIAGIDADPFYGAPAVLIVLANKEGKTYLYDGVLSMGNMLLESHALGLGSCYVFRAKEEFERPEGKELLASLGIEGDFEGIGHCIVGYTDGEYPPEIPRKDGRVFSC